MEAPLARPPRAGGKMADEDLQVTFGPESLTPLPPPPPTLAVPAPILAPAQQGVMLPIPGNVSQTSVTSGGTSGRVMTPALREAGQEREAAGWSRMGADKAALGAAEAEAKGVTLRAEASNLKLQNEVQDRKIKSDIDSETLRGVQAVKAEGQRVVGQKEQQYKDEQTKGSFWGEQKTWQKVLWGISLALGAYGSALSRKENTPLQMLSKTIDDWDAKRTNRLSTLANELKDARGYSSQLQKDYVDQELKFRDAKISAAWGQVGDRFEQETLKLTEAGNQEAAARGQKLVADARAKQAEHRERAALQAEQQATAMAPTYTGPRETKIIQQAGGAVSENAVLDRVTGQPIGNAPSKAEGAKSREALAQLKPIEQALTDIKALVDQTGLKDRIPVAGQYTDVQKNIQGLLNPIIPLISQITGSGTPQEGEARRLLATITVDASQGKEVAAKNIDKLQSLLQGAYDSKAKTLVPGYAGPQDAAKTPSIPAGAVKGKYNGKSAYSTPDGVFDAETGAKLE